MSRRDVLTEILVELRDQKQRIALLIARVSDEIEHEDAMYERILKAVRESDEAVTGMGTIAPEMGTLCHDFAPPPVAHICAEDEPPSREP